MKALSNPFATLNVLVIGDIMLDTYIHGTVDRISPEAPVPVLRYVNTQHALGGAANVALNLKKLHCNKVDLISIMGEDSNADTIINLLKKEKIEHKGILKIKERQTTQKTRMVSSKHQLMRLDIEQTHNLSNTEKEKVYKKLNSLLSKNKYHICILQDYNKGIFDTETIASIISTLNKHKIPIAVDPKKENFLAYTNVDLFKPNYKELVQGLGINYANCSSKVLKDASKKLKELINHKVSLFTLSDKGMYIEKAKENYWQEATSIEVVDVCGAGDTVISVAACGLALGFDIKKIARWSSLAAAIVCKQSGVVPIHWEQLCKEV